MLGNITSGVNIHTVLHGNFRYALAAMSAAAGDDDGVLDAGLVWNRNHKVQLPPALQRPFVGMANASRWRFLISTDGHTASSRLGHLLGINSVVLKERSPWIEYYYRALKEGKDHLAFSVDELLPMLGEIRVGRDKSCTSRSAYSPLPCS